uniref:Venom S1 protease 18 n=1 Tax=Lethocerus distinctifemur TaxID=280095 RepID=A0A2K8JRD6_9HEMI|nr:venom S1 protease 18 [Lethocerus distinctifemur]
MVQFNTLLLVGLLAYQCVADSSSSSSGSDEHGQFVGARKTNCTCGQTNKAVGRIVNGQRSGVNEYPHMVGVAMMVDNVLTTFCGGNLLTHHHVLTAAHCNHDDERKRFLKVADHDTQSDTESKYAKIYAVDEVLEHELYDPVFFQYDIAILVTKTRIEFNLAVLPICLPTGPLEIEGKSVKVTGWGRTSLNQNPSRYLMKADLKVLNLDICESNYNRSYINVQDVHQLCAIGKNQGICIGDSGGGLIWLDPETNRYTLVGLNSLSKSCHLDYPMVATNVAVFIDWIQDQISSSTDLTDIATCGKI